MRFVDIPPVWLLGCLVVTYWVGRWVPLDLGAAGQVVGGALVGAGLVLIAAAGWEFLKARTSIVPRDAPNALITSGIFQLTRNPIYLADLLILLGLMLRWDALFAWPLLILFALLVDRRFIRQEEEILSSAFPEAFPAYLRKVRRWL